MTLNFEKWIYPKKDLGKLYSSFLLSKECHIGCNFVEPLGKNKGECVVIYKQNFRYAHLLAGT